jgi:predicted  nucleic acid-binding Zn-ribbon protein
MLLWLMPTPASTALDLAEREIRQLKDTISAMRQEMEAMTADSKAKVQQVAAEYRDETVQLKAAVQATRDQLEQMRQAHQRAVQQAVADANIEIGQLKGTIVALREKLDRLHGR